MQSVAAVLSVIGAIWGGAVPAAALDTTSTTLSSSPNPSGLGDAITLSATVTGQTGGAPTGTVTFKDGTATLGTGTLAAVGVTRATRRLVSGGDHTCLITATGGVKCWGFNSNGQLGNGTLTDSYVAVDVTGLPASPVVQIAVGYQHTCALTAAGSVWCWGRGEDGQVGHGIFGSALVPVEVLASGAVEVSAGTAHTCATMDTVRIKCWGEGSDYRLFSGSFTDVNTPRTVGISSEYTPYNGTIPVALGAIGSFTCFLSGPGGLGTGGLICWGKNTSGQMGRGSTTNEPSEAPAYSVLDPDPPGTFITFGSSGNVDFGGGRDHLCVLRDDGRVFCSGVNGRGENGNGTYDATALFQKAAISGAKAISGSNSGFHTCVITATNGVKCWGGNYDGQIGNGETSFAGVTLPTDVVGLTSGVVEIAAGNRHTCALKDNGTVVCWGANDLSQLGAGDTLSRIVPSDPVSGVSVPLSSTATFSTDALGAGVHSLTAVYPATGSFATSTSATVSHEVAQEPTTTALASATNPTVYGQAATVVATVTAAVGTPTGSVQFKEGATVLGTVALSGGTASFSKENLSVGAHTLTAAYLGSGTHLASTSGGLAQTVGKANSQIVLSALPTIRPDATFTLRATVSAVAPSTKVPAGTVTFKRGTTTIGSVAPVNGIATLATSVGPGSYSFTASYAADTQFNASVSVARTATVDPLTSTAKVTSSDASAVFGQSVTLTATVTASGTTPTGTVTFKNGATTLGSAALSAGKAMLTTAALKVGSHSITVVYAGTGSITGSTSAPLSQAVSQVPTKVTLTVPALVRPGTKAMLSATVATTATTTASLTGSVAFKNGGTLLRTVALAGGSASLTTALPIGANAITAEFVESTNFDASTSAAKTVAVTWANGAPWRLNVQPRYDQTSPSVAPYAGGAVAVWAYQWAADSAFGVAAQRISKTGAKYGPEINVILPSGSLDVPQAVGLNNGGFVVLWHSNGTGGRDIFAQRFTAVAGRRGGIIGLNEKNADDQAFPQVAPLPAGGFVLVWQTRGPDGSGYGIAVRRFDDDAAPLGPETVVNTTTAGDQTGPVVATLSTGGFVIAWVGPSGTKKQVFAQRYNAAGAKVGTEFTVGTATASVPKLAVTALSSGRFAIAWDANEGASASTPKDVWLQRYRSTGVAEAAASRLNTDLSGSQSDPALAVLSSGEFVAAWTAPDSASTGIDAQVFTSAGSRVETSFGVNTVQTAAQSLPAVAALPDDGGYVVVWMSDGEDGDGKGVYVQHFVAP